MSVVSIAHTCIHTVHVAELVIRPTPVFRPSTVEVSVVVEPIKVLKMLI